MCVKENWDGWIGPQHWCDHGGHEHLTNCQEERDEQWVACVVWPQPATLNIPHKP